MSRTQNPPELSEKKRREKLYRHLLNVSQAPSERLNEVLQNTTFWPFVPGSSLESCAPYLQVDDAIRRGQSPPRWAILEELRTCRQFFVDTPRKLIEKIRTWLPIEGQPDCPPAYKSESAILKKVRDDLAVFHMLRWLFLNWCADAIKDRSYTPSLTTHVLDRWPHLKEAQAAVSIAFAALTEPYEGPDDWRYSDSTHCRTKLPPLSGNHLGMFERAVQGLALVLNQCEQEYAALPTGPVPVVELEAADKGSIELDPSLDHEGASILPARENRFFFRTINQALEFVPRTKSDSPAPESREESLARLRENEAIIADNWLAPPRGSAVVCPEPGGRTVRERPTEDVRQLLAERYPIEQCCLNSWFQLVWVGKVCELLRVPVAEGGRCETDTEHLERLTVGAILNLWRCVTVGRIFLNVWGDELSVCREMRSFRCPLGEYPSATHAVQALAEEVLAELWETAWESDPPPGPPYDEDICFAAGCDLPRFRVDWWYGALPALRQHFRALPNRWELEEKSGGQTCWEAGLQQEQAALRQRQRLTTQTATDEANTGIQPDSPTADWCLLPGRSVRWEGEPIELQKRLWDLLEYLLTHHSHSLQQGEIEDAVWGEGQEISSKTFANTISRLNAALAAISFPWTWRVSAGEVFRD